MNRITSMEQKPRKYRNRKFYSKIIGKRKHRYIYDGDEGFPDFLYTTSNREQRCWVGKKLKKAVKNDFENCVKKRHILNEIHSKISTNSSVYLCKRMNYYSKIIFESRKKTSKQQSKL